MRSPGEVDDVWLRPSSLGHLDRLLNDEGAFVEEHPRVSAPILGPIRVIANTEDSREYLYVQRFN